MPIDVVLRSVPLHLTETPSSVLSSASRRSPASGARPARPRSKSLSTSCGRAAEARVRRSSFCCRVA